MHPFSIALDNLVVLSATCSSPEHWKNWAITGATTPQADLQPNKTSHIPPMLRRRLTPLGKLVLEALARVVPVDNEVIIFASSWGDIGRSRDLIMQMNQEADISPMGFASSVHNAIGAVASIWLKNPAPYSAVCAGTFTTEAAFVEAYSRLANGAKSVLIVRYESTLPDIWANSIQQATDATYVWACRVNPINCQSQLRLRLTRTDTKGQVQEETQELRFLLSEKKVFKHIDDAGGWVWERI